jgi:hypothetical protein
LVGWNAGILAARQAAKQPPEKGDDIMTTLIRHFDEHGRLHREDGPAVIWSDGSQNWWQHGKIHRDDGPAVVLADGAQYWYQHGELHREDGPAVIRADGTQEWRQQGKRHREDGPALVWADGSQCWYKHGKPHREDGPAQVFADGSQYWYQHGELHREDGPAVMRADGREQWIHYIWTDPRGYELSCVQHNLDTNEIRFTCGCRAFLLDEAIAHWGGDFYPDKELGKAFVSAIEAYLKKPGNLIERFGREEV